MEEITGMQAVARFVFCTIVARRWCLVGICVSMAMHVSVAFASPSMTFEDAQARLEQQSDALAAADAAVLQRQNLQEASRSLRLPEIGLDVQHLKFNKAVEIPLGPLQPIADRYDVHGPLSRTFGGWRTRPILSAVLPLYTGGSIPAAQKAASAATEGALAEREVQRQVLLVQLVQLYFGQQLAEMALGIRRDTLEGLEQHLDNAMRLEREGFATRAQRMQVVVARDKAQREYEKARNDLATLASALATTLHSETPVQVVSPLFIDNGMPNTLAEFENIALLSHPQLKALRSMAVQAEQGIAVQEASLKPQVYLFGQYDLKKQDQLLTDPDWIIGVGIRYTLVSPQDRPRQIGAARAQSQRAKYSLREAENQVLLGVRKAWYELSTAREQYQLLASSIAQAKENLRLQELSFRNGQATSLDVIDARLALGGARVERAQAAYEYDVALAMLLQASGQMHRYDEFRRRAKEIHDHD